MAILLVIGVAPFMVGLLALYRLLGIGMPYVGFFFLLYWAGMLQQAWSKFIPAVAGGAGGIGVSWALVTLSGQGTVGQVATIAILVPVLFCFMRGHVPVLFNNAMMLFLIVATIPELDVTRSAPTMLASLALAAIYMGAVAAALFWVTRRRNAA